MKIVDANVLLYTVNADAHHHAASRAWLDAALSGSDRVGLAWSPLLAFVRLATSARVFATPLTAAAAMGQVSAWLAAPSAVVVHPTARHADVLAGLLDDAGAAANLTNDGHLAALALEHRGQVVSYDTDFARFPRVRWSRPDDLL